MFLAIAMTTLILSAQILSDRRSVYGPGTGGDCRAGSAE